MSPPRMIIIDNYDSFTFNLAAYIEEITGVAPTIIHNDEPGWTVAALERFDAIIISPGPGHPGRPADFGMCAEVIEHSTVPLLGVCLGHQGLALAHGGEVDLAPEPMHGRVSRVHHEGSGLFHGIPQTFDVVRYHSLAVIDQGSQLRGTAWSEDGVLMAVEHPTRPQWGVQFHPESIGGQFGRQLIANFLQLAMAHRYRWVVTERIIDIEVDPALVFDTIYGSSTHSFWLDDVQGTSYLGDASGPHARMASHRVGSEESFFEWLKYDLRANSVAPGEGFQLGWVGYLGYELKHECGSPNRHHSPHPDAQLIFADRAIAIESHRVRLLCLDNQDEWCDTIAARLHELAPRPNRGAAPQLTDFEIRDTATRYRTLIERAQEHIRYGESYEVCLTTQLSGHSDVDPLTAYLHLRTTNPTAYGSFLRFGELNILSSSPERFLSIDSAGRVESKPIKGTRGRGDTDAADNAIREELAFNPKDRAENLMIVDLVRNDLARVARPASVSVDKLFDVETYATVHQLVSTVSAELGAGNPIDCVRAAFPGGSMTGAPKLRTMEIIDALETGPRGIYSGGLGYFSLDGAVDLSMVIRTMVMHQGQLSYGVGGAILSLSDPVAEWEEIKVKSRPLLDLFEVDFP